MRPREKARGMSAIAFAPVRIHGLDTWLAGLHAAAKPGKPTLLVVPPFPHEWQRGYRLFALLSQALAGHGIGSLRFDASGCGDSCGDDEAFSLDQLQADLQLALDWLRALGAGPIVLLGVRAGALAASAVAQRQGMDWIGWQPVAVGSDYLAALEAREARELRNRRRFGARLPLGEVDPHCLLGHRLHPGLRGQLRSARVGQPACFSVDAELPAALASWVEEIDLATPFPLPQVRALAAELAPRLEARA